MLSRARASRAERAERVERFEEDLWRRADVGIILTPPYEEEDWRFEYGSGRFWVLVVKRSEVDDVVEATEAVCALRADSSRVSRFTYRVLSVMLSGESRYFIEGGALDVQCFLVLSQVLGEVLQQ